MFINFSSIKGFMVDKPFERELKVLLSPDTHHEIKGFTFILSTLSPNGGCTDYHSHLEAGELMIFLSGTGKAWCEGSEYDIKPGTALYAPPGSVHKTQNTGSDPLQIACIFIPAISTDYIRKSQEESKKARGRS